MGRLFLLFTVVPLLELYLLLWVGGRIGFWPTVGMVLVTALLGATMAKREGLRVLREWQGTLAAGRMPEEGVLGAVLVLVGGALLVAPGILTDLAGLSLLFPPTRKLIGAQVKKRLERSVKAGTVRVSGFGMGPFGQVRPPEARAVDPSNAADPSWDRAPRAREPQQVEDAEVVDESEPGHRM